MFADRLKKSLLQAAIQGQLTEQLPTDGNARDLLRKIRAEKAKLISAKKIKVEKLLPLVSDDEVPFDLPNNWCWCRLGEICNYGTTETILPPDMEQGKLLIDLEDIEKDTGKLINRKFFDGTNANSSKNIFQRRQVLFGKLRVYLNKVIVADQDGYCSSEILPLDFGRNILSKYAQTVLMSPPFLSYANSCSYGTKMPRLGTKAGQLALFPLPPLSEQKRIVARLEELLAEVNELAHDERELIELEENFPRRMRNSLLQSAIQGKLTEQLSNDGDARDLLRKIHAEKAKLLATKKIKAEKLLPPVTDDEIPFDLPNNWCWCRLGELCEHLQRGKSPKYSQIKKYPVVAQKCNQSCGFTMEQAKFIDPDTIVSYSKERFLQADDLLWNSTGLGTVGRVAIYDPSKNLYELAVADSHVTVIRLIKNFALPRFVFCYITSPVVQFKMDLMVSGSTKQKELATETVRNLIVPLPPLDEQKRIVERLEKLLPLCEDNCYKDF